jgi:hypothetical protein
MTMVGSSKALSCTQCTTFVAGTMGPMSPGVIAILDFDIRRRWKLAFGLYDFALISILYKNFCKQFCVNLRFI